MQRVTQGGRNPFRGAPGDIGRRGSTGRQGGSIVRSNIIEEIEPEWKYSEPDWSNEIIVIEHC